MRTGRWSGRAMLASLALLLLIGATTSVEARTRYRYRRHSAAVVALQPFVAAPVLSAPIRVAYQTSPTGERIFEGRAVDEGEITDGAIESEDGNVAPQEDAYFTSRIRRQRPPRGNHSGWVDDDDDDDDAPRRVNAHEDLSGGSKPLVSGSRAVLRNGVAQAPANAPASVKNAIWAANTIRRKPYVWGGGHGSFNDRGYDCSGTVSFALHSAGVLATPLPSSDFMRYGEGGRGRWITVYSRPGHTFAMIAGLRLDTTDFAIGGNVGPRWHEDGRDTFGYVARHPAGL